MDKDITALRAVAHPVRLRITSLLTGTAMSAAEVARELGITHAAASYHLRLLRQAGEVEEAGEEVIRGGVAKRYRYPHDRGRDTEQPPEGGLATTDPDDWYAYQQAVRAEVVRRSRLFRPGQGRSFDLEGWVDAATWRQALELMEQASRLLHDANRPPGTAETVHVSATATLFRMRDVEESE